MLGPVRVHLLGLFKPFSWGVWEDVWKHCGKMKKSQLSKDQWESPPFFSVPCTKKESVCVEGGQTVPGRPALGLHGAVGRCAGSAIIWREAPSSCQAGAHVSCCKSRLVMQDRWMPLGTSMATLGPKGRLCTAEDPFITLDWSLHTDLPRRDVTSSL